MILVTALLALMAIIAVVYVTRTHAERAACAGRVRAGEREAHAQRIGRALAAEIALALFVEPLEGAGDRDGAASSNRRRSPPRAHDRRYGVDPRHGYNFAPFHVVPETNWPDGNHEAGEPPWPAGAAAFPRRGDAPVGRADLAEPNAPGNPGMGDTRWLRSSEPLRWDEDADGRPDSFRLWRHLTNVCRVNNGFRVCRDISDITDHDRDGIGGYVSDLRIPVEQWLASVLPAAAHFNPATGDADATTLMTDANGNGASDFIDAWQAWMSVGYASVYANAETIPPNFYCLRDLDADGIALEPGERPVDAFRDRAADPLGTTRWNVERVLSDSDGDGFTDSFWFLDGLDLAGDEHRVVSVSIVDHGSMLNARVATRFVAGMGSDDRGAIEGRRIEATRGETPADLALVGAQGVDGLAGIRGDVGYLDAPHNQETAFDVPPGFGGTSAGPFPLYDRGAAGGLQVQWRGDAYAPENRWHDLLVTLGVRANVRGRFPHEWCAADERWRYWSMAVGRRDPDASGVFPFLIADEIELRLYHGQNHPWILSRFERAVNTDGHAYAFLRSGRGFEETTPYLDQLSNPELLHDHRRRLTVFNGARNDELPPWLHWRGGWLPERVRDRALGSGIAVDRAARSFFAQSRRKLDLREARDVALRPGECDLVERLPWTLLHAWSDGHADAGHGFFGPYDSNDGGARDLRRLAASFTANLLAYRDADTNADPYADVASGHAGAVPLPQWGSAPADDSVRFLGIERQPFLLEAFVGHVYEALVIPGAPELGVPGWENSGARMLVGDDPHGGRLHSTVAVVQIANPFARPIDLRDPRIDFEIELLGQRVSLAAVAEAVGACTLPPARATRPATMTLFAIDESLGAAPEFKRRWLDFLDLEVGDHPVDADPETPDTLLIDLVALAALDDRIDSWSTHRSAYDTSDPASGLRLIRVTHGDVAGGRPGSRVVIDRMDPWPVSTTGFGARVRAMGGDRPPTWSEIEPMIPAPSVEDPPVHPGAEWTPPASDQTHWAQWVRVTRAWGYPDADGVTGPWRRNPRYVNARHRVTSSIEHNDPRAGYASRVFSARGVAPGTSFTLANDPDRAEVDADQPWFTHPYTTPDGTVHVRKPTFLDMNRADDPARVSAGASDPGPGWSHPDKGFYHSPFSMQMLQKDADVQQIGEVLNVWLWGHELAFGLDGRILGTQVTFAEHVARSAARHPESPFVNRMPIRSHVRFNAVLGRAFDAPWDDRRHATPELTAAARTLDAFVCDGPGFERVGASEHDAGIERRFDNAVGFSRRATPGLVNLSTAPVEVLRALPHWYALVPVTSCDAPPIRSALPEAVVTYRERFGNFDAGDMRGSRVGFANGPDGRTRGVGRAGPGLASIGEVRELTTPGWGASGSGLLDSPIADAWRSDFAARWRPRSDGSGELALGTDVVPGGDPGGVDGVRGDSEERNLLFSGASNAITTRSDVFTVAFRIRTFKPHPLSGRWDATDRERIVDDARYVMLVDRSNVDDPTDDPHIVFFQRVAD